MSTNAVTEDAIPIGSTPTDFAAENQKTYVKIEGTKKLSDVYQIFLPTLVLYHASAIFDSQFQSGVLRPPLGL